MAQPTYLSLKIINEDFQKAQFQMSTLTQSSHAIIDIITEAHSHYYLHAREKPDIQKFLDSNKLIGEQLKDIKQVLGQSLIQFDPICKSIKSVSIPDIDIMENVQKGYQLIFQAFQGTYEKYDSYQLTVENNLDRLDQLYTGRTASVSEEVYQNIYNEIEQIVQTS